MPALFRAVTLIVILADEPTLFAPAFDPHGTEPSLVGSIRLQHGQAYVFLMFVSRLPGARHLATGSGNVLNPSEQPAWRVLLLYQRRP